MNRPFSNAIDGHSSLRGHNARYTVVYFLKGLHCFLLTALVLAPLWLSSVAAMRQDRITKLRDETVGMFYHGFDNYMRVAFPEDELRPVSCIPLTRDPQNSRNFELNDVLGNYSLTLIDSLSTLAILASAPSDSRRTGPKALADFQLGVAALVEQYGDGRRGPSGQGIRGRGFDVDSKVQVFETVIRGVGGLLSAHLFAIGELPIAGYDPGSTDDVESHPIAWTNGLHYDGQLLRLALDLAQRLLPAFYTATGLPYPRVNLRHGIPFYVNSPLHRDVGDGGAKVQGPPEITETCSAGAGSLVLEFTALSRLTGDQRFEQAAKRAFWAVWERRSNIGLIGAGVDAEKGQWIGSYAGIGAGADSFFEYAFKTHILLSGREFPNQTLPLRQSTSEWLDPNDIYTPLTAEENSSDMFLRAWQDAHAAIKRHLYTRTQHPHYVNANIATGSPQAYWIDSLGAYYSGLLTLAGELDEAIETHLLYTALWTRFAALPERWSIRDNTVEGGLGWWPGRPEFIESTYYLYRATKDPWYLYVGEMVLRDISQNCWTECGWSGLQDVRTGEKSDRMESFFLGETTKYMYLLFDEEHPLNCLDAGFVFTTEGHPLIIPQKYAAKSRGPDTQQGADPAQFGSVSVNDGICPLSPQPTSLSGSSIASRPDIYHAAKLIGLHNTPNHHAAAPRNPEKRPVHGETIKVGHQAMPVLNHTVFPWTLPQTLLPCDGICAKPPMPHTLLIEFPSTTQQNVGSAFNYMFGNQGLSRMGQDGLLVQNMPGLKMTLLEENTSHGEAKDRYWRVVNVGGVNLGRDEKVFVSRETIGDLSDPLFSKVREAALVDVIVQVNDTPPPVNTNIGNVTDMYGEGIYQVLVGEDGVPFDVLSGEDGETGATTEYKSLFSSLLRAIRDPNPTGDVEDDGISTTSSKTVQGKQQANKRNRFRYLATLGITPIGAGSGPLPDVAEAPSMATLQVDDKDAKEVNKPLAWASIYVAGEACDNKLPDEAARDHQLIIIRRGGCSFSEKLANIPAYTPGAQSLQIVIVVSDDYEVDPETGAGRVIMPGGVRPLLDQIQRTPSGITRRTPISMLLVHGGDEVYNLLAHAASVGTFSGASTGMNSSGSRPTAPRSGSRQILSQVLSVAATNRAPGSAPGSYIPESLERSKQTASSTNRHLEGISHRRGR
ncbi:hypothetical protein MKZ38_009367 [Zalerion maritima]|uniref:alpha-1,2-Mannosidase n=1 Tax=Zalerion maritima TaxID=339359 RepID=A0AAD5RGV5_9PEZI|nr:hypothetical protein MKZ38_009367 [Zalerion maritima]